MILLLLLVAVPDALYSPLNQLVLLVVVLVVLTAPRIGDKRLAIGVRSPVGILENDETHRDFPRPETNISVII